MNCPSCFLPRLARRNHGALPFDYCAECGGVWLSAAACRQFLEAAQSVWPEKAPELIEGSVGAQAPQVW